MLCLYCYFSLLQILPGASPHGLAASSPSKGGGGGGSGGLEEGEVDMSSGEPGKKSAQLSYNQRTVQKWEEDEKLGKFFFSVGVGGGANCGAGAMWIRNHFIGRLKKKNELHFNCG